MQDIRYGIGKGIYFKPAFNTVGAGNLTDNDELVGWIIHVVVAGFVARSGTGNDPLQEVVVTGLLLLIFDNAGDAI